MKKILTIFVRDAQTHRVTDQFVPNLPSWFAEGLGAATLKYDGTSCLVRDGVLYRRYELRPGKKAPAGFAPAQEPDPATGRQPGWVPVGTGPEDHWHRVAWAAGYGRVRDPWTYELVGPKVQGAPYGAMFTDHILQPHGDTILAKVPRNYGGLRTFFTQHVIEGIVWWRDTTDIDSERLKIKRHDFGLPWPAPMDAGSNPVAAESELRV